MQMEIVCAIHKLVSTFPETSSKRVISTMMTSYTRANKYEYSMCNTCAFAMSNVLLF